MAEGSHTTCRSHKADGQGRQSHPLLESSTGCCQSRNLPVGLQKGVLHTCSAHASKMLVPRGPLPLPALCFQILQGMQGGLHTVCSLPACLTFSSGRSPPWVWQIGHGQANMVTAALRRSPCKQLSTCTYRAGQGRAKRHTKLGTPPSALVRRLCRTSSCS